MEESLGQLNKRLEKLNKTIDQHLDSSSRGSAYGVSRAYGVCGAYGASSSRKASHKTIAWCVFVLCVLVFAGFVGYLLANNGTPLQWSIAAVGLVLAIGIMFWSK